MITKGYFLGWFISLVIACICAEFCAYRFYPHDTVTQMLIGAAFGIVFTIIGGNIGKKLWH